MRNVVAALFIAAVVVGCAPNPPVGKKGKLSNEEIVLAYKESRLMMCVRGLSMEAGLKEVKVREASDYCQCLIDAEGQGLSATDIETMLSADNGRKLSTLDGFELLGELVYPMGKIESFGGFRILGNLIARREAAEPACKARALSAY